MPDSIECRIEQLETKISFQENTIEDLNQHVINLQNEIFRLKDQLNLLLQKFKATQESNIAFMSEETPPPHY